MGTFRNCYYGFEPKRVEEKAPVMIDGVEAINTLCPVSKLTGHRTNPLTLLGMVSDGNARLLDNILQVLPEVKQMDAPDDVKIDMLVPSDLGSFAERDAMISRLADVADILFEKPSDVAQAATVLDTSVEVAPE